MAVTMMEHQHVHFHSHQQRDEHHHWYWMADSIRPFGIGMAHRFTGSATLSRMVLTATYDIGTGLLSIVLFAAGCFLGMIVIAVAIGVPAILSRSISHRLFTGGQSLVSGASVVIGAWTLVRLVT